MVSMVSARATRTAIILFSGILLLSELMMINPTQSFAAPAVDPEQIPYSLPPLGTVGPISVFRYEDIHKLSLPLADAVKLLRDKNYKEAELGFQKIQQTRPKEALAFQGEIEASQRLNTLNFTLARYKKLIAAMEEKPNGGTDQTLHLAILHWALGVATMLGNGYYPKLMIGPASNIGEQPLQQFQEALQLDPDLLVAHLSLAAYYDHESQQQGPLARQEYEEALRLRPDLYQIRYLHAMSWDLPPVILNQSQLVAQGMVIPEGKIRREDKAREEYLSLIHDHPNYAPPYYCLGDIYSSTDRATAYKYWRKYLELGTPGTDAWIRINQIIEYADAHPDAAR